MTDTAPTRPDPDALLAEVRRQDERRRRGKLKVFFGMSAGVGKTYAMLEEARKRAAEGLDVLVGYAEPHIRPDTEAVLVALDILPYKLVEYRETTLKEFDLDAALARRPAVCCVDELAHTNAPGLRHPKRWQDVDELLAAGIDVYTTLNVQHLESVNDLVERITGVRVRETLPDAVFDAADEVELVDIAPDELLERFREGRIYRPEQAERAARHFFTKGNLIALRELALRKTAERVDEQVQQYRRDERLRQVVPASEKVLVCVGPSPLSARLVRSARRLAWGLRAKLVAVCVEPEAGAAVAGEGAAANLKLAEELGADVVTLTGRRIATEVLAYAHTHNVTKIVVGKPDRPRWRDWLFGSVVDDLIRGSGEIDVYVIRSATDSERRTPPSPARRPRHDWPGYILATIVVALVTAVSWPLFHRFGVENENVLMLYLLGVLLVATRRSRAAALLTGALSVAAFDFVFVPPYYTFSISDRQYMVTFVVMLLTALVISVQTHRVRAHAEAARRRERHTAALLSLSRDLAASQSTAQIATATERHTRDALGFSAVVLTPDRTAATPALLALGEGVPVGEKEMSVARWAFEHDRPAGAGTDTLPAAAGTYVPLRGPRGIVGVLGVFARDRSPPAGTQRHTVEAFAAQAALAIERAELADEAREAWERVEAESLRNTLLSAVSHDLRTPLAGITGVATTLLDTGDHLSPTDRRDLLTTLVDEADRLARLLTNLLDMTRMEAGGLSLNRDWTPVGDMIEAALRGLDRRLAGRTVTVAIAPDVPLVHVDETALGQVFVNLVQNAIDHTPPGSAIDISADAAANGRVRIRVADRGPGLPAGDERRVFDKFFRGPVRPDRGQGVGLGLAICRGIVEAHGGTITARNRPGGGAEFVIHLPIGGTPPAVDTSA